jgi:hypothetical protein
MIRFDHQEMGGVLSSHQPAQVNERWEGQEIDNQHHTIDSRSWISCPGQNYMQLNRVSNYFVTGEDK